MRTNHTGARVTHATSSGATAIERSMFQTTSVTSYIFRAPAPHKLAAFIIILSLATGFLINFDLFNLINNFSATSIYENAVIFGLVLIGIPAIISALISTPLANIFGGTFYFRRSFLLAFISMIFLIIILFLGKVLRIFFTFDFLIIFIFGYALIFSVRHIVLLATSHHKNLNSISASINQTIFGFLFLWISSNVIFQVTVQDLYYMLVFTLIFLVITLLWIRIITTPFRRNFGVNGLMLMKHALSQFTEDLSSGKALEKEFFSKIGSRSNLRVGVVGIRELQENGASKIETLLVIPSIHPGPFGILGGSNLPTKLTKYLKGITTNLMVFHGPATHDLNPVSTQECKKIALVIRKLAREMKYSENVSTLYRSKLSTGSSTKSNLTICGQRFGNGIVYTHTSSPESTDDIDNSVGEAIIEKAEADTKAKALFIDAHNCLKPGTGGVFFGSKKANNMLKLVSKLNKKLKKATKFEIHSAYVNDSRFSVSEGFGPSGIQVLIIKCVEKSENDGKHFAYILLDGNNVIPGLREQILAAIVDLVEDAEVFTTDNHIVNATMRGYNPVGLKIDPARIIASTRALVKEGILKTRPCEVGISSGLVKDIKILGQNTPMRISTTINSTISIMGNSLIACQALALAVCWLVAII